MGLSSGSVSYLRFVAEPVPEAFEPRFCEALWNHRFQEIDPHGEIEKAHGWVRFDDAFEAEIDPESLVLESGQLLLRLRIDTLKIPAATLKAYVDKAAKDRAKKDGRDLPGKKEREALKLEVAKQLRVRSLPRMQLVEAAWNVHDGEVRLFSTSKGVAGLFVDHFEKTFERKLQFVGLLEVLPLRGMTQQEIDGLALIDAERFHLIAR
ncbi:MAG: recombination-associated protein RdgC [Deltaproteobacteria bacterium]|nr:recombination-associated protein RdgC [Deltaproteobacteria bacterium]